MAIYMIGKHLRFAIKNIYNCIYTIFYIYNKVLPWLFAHLFTYVVFFLSLI